LCGVKRKGNNSIHLDVGLPTYSPNAQVFSKRKLQLLAQWFSFAIGFGIKIPFVFSYQLLSLDAVVGESICTS